MITNTHTKWNFASQDCELAPPNKGKEKTRMEGREFF